MTNGRMYNKGERICEKCGKTIIHDSCSVCDNDLKEGYIRCEFCGCVNKKDTSYFYYGEYPKLSQKCRICGEELYTRKQREFTEKIITRDMDRLRTIIENLDMRLKASEKLIERLRMGKKGDDVK